MKAYPKVVILSVKIDENILKFNFLMGGIRHIDCLHKFFKAVMYRCRSVIILYTDKKTLNRHYLTVNELDAK